MQYGRLTLSRYQNNDPYDTLYIPDFHLFASIRGIGIGSFMLAHAQRMCASSGIRRVYGRMGGPDADLSRLPLFYKRHGFAVNEKDGVGLSTLIDWRSWHGAPVDKTASPTANNEASASEDRHWSFACLDGFLHDNVEIEGFYGMAYHAIGLRSPAGITLRRDGSILYRYPGDSLASDPGEEVGFDLPDPDANALDDIVVHRAWLLPPGKDYLGYDAAVADVLATDERARWVAAIKARHAFALAAASRA